MVRSEALELCAVACAKMTEPIKMLFGMWTQVGSRKHILAGGAHCHHLVNMIELSMCGVDAAFLSNLTTCLF